MEPSGFSLTLETYLHPITFLLVGRSTKDHVLFLKKAEYSSIMAIFQFSFCKASLADWGSLVTLYTFGLKMSFLDLVIIECVFPIVFGIDDDTMGALKF